MTLSVRTTSSSGLLVWTSHGATPNGDFLAVAVVDGVPELTFALGQQQGPVTIRAEVEWSTGI